MKCYLCGKEFIVGRQCLNTKRLICDSTSCAGEYYLNNTSRIGDEQ